MNSKIPVKPVPQAPLPVAPVVCPHLGLRDDPTVVAAAPTTAHACYAKKNRYLPPREHQATYCLATAHQSCPYFPETPSRPAQVTAPTSIGLGVRRRRRYKRWISASAALLCILVAVAYGAHRLLPDQFSNITRATEIPATDVEPPTPDSSLFVAAETPTPQPVMVVALPTVTPTPAVRRTSNRFVTPTPVPGGQVVDIPPSSGGVGWWASDIRHGNISDSFLYAGSYQGDTFVALVRFDLSRIPRGAPLHQAILRLTGLREERLAPGSKGAWLVQLIAESSLPDFAGADFLTVYSAPASITLLPQLQASSLGAGRVNLWELDETVRAWLAQQLIDGATSVTVRILGSTGESAGLFAWDSGAGSQSKGAGPRLLLSLGPPPPTPPPLPTRPVIVATLTPVPQNVLTVVAYAATATAEAAVFGTPTPLPYSVWTPTPFPENLATVQAVAVANGLPPVVLDTPAPANAATATANAEYATAVALTTGTFTPVPTNYVTPVVVRPSPPPENVATAAARVVAATAAAENGIAAPTLPWNAVMAVYEYATATPANAETAVALIQEMNFRATTTGTPTPTPWNLVIITPVPPPPPTPIPLVVAADQITPTPTPTPTRVVAAADLESLRGKVLFLSDRSGGDQVWAMDPATGEVLSLITDMQLYTLARELFLANSPDGRERAIVQEDDSRILQIKVLSHEWNTTRQLTTFTQGISYDPAWSPRGDKIAFVSNESGGDEIYVMDPEGQELQQLTFNTWEWDKHPSWSPDGSQIVFWSNRETGRQQIWIMNADGSNQRNLSNSQFNDWDPVWIR